MEAILEFIQASFFALNNTGRILLILFSIALLLVVFLLL